MLVLTGIWTRMVCDRNVKSSVAIEPNNDMREFGEADSTKFSIKWMSGSGENTGLDQNSADLVTMASSFHWTDFDKSTAEFNRILRPGGVFAALWNPRLVEANPLLLDIENRLEKIKGKPIERVSSGRSGIAANLSEKLRNSSYFSDVIYVEGRHVQYFTKEQYIGVWRSVNDLQANLGAEKFELFMDYVQSKISDAQTIEATYVTRGWLARTQ